MTEVCLVIGAGACIGGHVAKRFARGGQHAVLVRRSDQAGLDRIIGDIEAKGGQASGVLLNAAEDGSLEALVERVEADVGPITTAVYNLGAQIGSRPLEATTLKQFELGWRLGCFGLFRLAKAVVPKMAARGSGSLLVTSATAALRGNSGQASHAAAMAGRRMVCQSVAAEYAGQGVHVAHIVVDSAVDAPDTLGKMLGAERFAQLRETHELMDPAAIAETYWHLAQQPPSVWTFELDLRAHSDLAWWNHAP